MQLTLQPDLHYNPSMYDAERLEYQKALDIIKDYCGSDYSKTRLLATVPTRDRGAIIREFQLLGELGKVIALGHVPESGRVHDTKGLLARARVKGSALPPEELAKIRENIIHLDILKRQFEPLKKEFPLLARKIGEVRIPLALLKRIDSALDEHGRVRDDASPRLAEITARQRSIRQRIEAELYRYLNSPDTRQYLQERHITLKDDRYVIPVKQSFRESIPGVVHAHSGSEKTVFVEPFSIIDDNNELRMVERERELEVHRILVALTGAVREKSAGLSQLQDTLADIDILMTKQRFMEEYGGTIPEFGEKREIIIEGGRHPLLRGRAVPVDFYLREPRCGVVITGPNTGGKTVTLKMVGLFVLLAQSGIPIPARMMRTSIFESVFADIGDESSIEQSLSTFSAHIRNIITITEEADRGSLVLIDELGAGTDPIEGGALGAAILDYLLGRGVFTIVTTHFSFIKMYALGSERTEVASVEFDSKTSRPTYRLIMGIPGRSNAIEVARHLGLSTGILHHTREYLSEEDRAVDGIFKNLALIEKELKGSKEEMTRQRETLERMIKEYRRKLDDVEERERLIRSEYGTRLSQMLAEFRKRLERSIKEVREGQGSKAAASAARDELARVEEEYARAVKPTGRNGEEKETLGETHVGEGTEESGYGATAGMGETGHEVGAGDVNPGDYVCLVHDGAGGLKGKVIDVSGDRITILAGSLSITVSRDHVRRLEVPGEEREEAASGKGLRGAGSKWSFAPAREISTAIECDIRGMRYDEGMSEVTHFIDKAVLGNAREVSIIHGLGTGALREGVQEILKKRREVDHYEYARPEQGGYGCTIVTLKS